jgi:hypothetical protein
MNKTCIAVASLFFGAFGLSAQNAGPDYREELQFGLKAGVNLSNVYDSQGEEFKTDPKFGIAAGAFVAIPIGKFVGIQPEILFSQKGFKASGKILGSTYKFTRTTNYIDIPILIQVKPSSNISVMAGPQYSFLIKQSDAYESSIMNLGQVKEFENDNIRKNIFCFLGGVDVNIEHVVLGARVGWDILNNNGDGTSTTPRYKNVWYQLTFGYRFY